MSQETCLNGIVLRREVSAILYSAIFSDGFFIELRRTPVKQGSFCKRHGCAIHDFAKTVNISPIDSLKGDNVGNRL